MSEGKFDELKGRAEEAAGDVTDDEELQREGKADQAAGKVRQKFDELVDKVRSVCKRD